jgi:hypothetical protein
MPSKQGILDLKNTSENALILLKFLFFIKINIFTQKANAAPYSALECAID